MRTMRLAIGFVAALAPAWPARAATLQVRSPVVIEVREDGKSSTYAGTFAVTATGPVTKVELEASPLAGQDKAAGSVIAAASVILGSLSFPAAGTRAVPITIASVPRAGTYAGTLALKGGAAPVAFDLTFVLHPRVAVKPAVEAAPFSQLRCLWRPSCWVSDLVTPKALNGSRRRLGVDSSTAELLQVDHVTASFDGEKTQTALVVQGNSPGAGSQGAASEAVADAGGPQVVVDPPADLAALSRSYATLTVARRRVPADRYRGTVRLFLREVEDPVVVPLTLDVRDGPIFAALVLIIGIFVGHKLQLRSTPAAKLRDAAMVSYHELESEIDRLPDARARMILGLDLRALRALIVVDNPDGTKIDALRSSIADRISKLYAVQELQLSAPSGNTAIDALARDAIDKILKAAGAAAIDEAMRKLQEAIQFPAPPPRRLLLAPLTAMEPQGLTQKAAFHVGKLVGTRWDRAEREYHWHRPLFGALLLVVLWLIGFQSLYVNGSGSFGSGGVWDYVPLFLWGLSADIAQRTLQNLPAVKGS